MKNKVFQFQLTKEFVEGFMAKMEAADYKGFFSKMKEAGDASASGEFKRMIISTDEIDRQGEIVLQDGYVLENYLAHPVVLLNHDYYNGLPVAMTDRIYREGNMTLADGKFAPTMEGQELRKYYEAGFPVAASVGFIPLDFGGDDGVTQITKAELLEWSFVKVPANAGCVSADDARKHSIDIAFMTSKGFEFTNMKTTTPIVNKKTVNAKGEDAEVGSPCEMDDGGAGVYAPDPAGDDKPLICVPVEASLDKGMKKEADKQEEDDLDKQAEDALWEDLKSEHAFHGDAVKGHVKEFTEGMKAEAEKEPAADADDEAKKAFTAEIAKAMEDHEKKFKSVMKAENDRHAKTMEKCVKDYKGKVNQDNSSDDDADDTQGGDKKPDQDADDSKMIAGKMADIEKAIGELKTLIVAKPTEGDDGQKGAPKQRSISASTFSGLPAMKQEDLETLVKTLHSATLDALTIMKDKRRSRDYR